MQKQAIAGGGNAEMAMLAETLNSQAEAIVRRWRESIQSDAAAGLLGVEPAELVREISDRIRQGGAATNGRPGEQRFAANLILAFRGLRQALIAGLVCGLGREPRSDELAAVDAVVDELMARQAAGGIDQELRDLRCWDQMQARYMSFLSHDLRGSLNGQVLMLEVMRRELAEGNTSEILEDIGMMRQSVLDAVNMVERYVQADRLRRGKVALHRQRLELRSIIEAAEAAVSETAGEKQARIETDVPEGAFVEADPELARQTLVHLLQNAIRHGGGGLIAVVAQRVGSEWTISVADRGPGIEPDRLERLIDPFRRCELKERGMGLTIAHYAMRLLGGRIEAESTPGHGSVFRMILPAAADGEARP